MNIPSRFNQFVRDSIEEFLPLMERLVPGEVIVRQDDQYGDYMKVCYCGRYVRIYINCFNDHHSILASIPYGGYRLFSKSKDDFEQIIKDALKKDAEISKYEILIKRKFITDQLIELENEETRRTRISLENQDS